MGAFKAARSVVGAACLAVSLLLLMASGATGGQPTCRVTGAGGTYDTLQAAVNAASAGETLKVKGTCYGDTTIGKNLTIVGHGKATLNGANSGSVVTVNGGATVAITRLTIEGGYGASYGLGGGISNNESSLTLADSTVTGNTAEDGGGILSTGDYGRATLTLNNSTVSANTGGGIHGEGHVTIANSTVTGNVGRGVRADSAPSRSPTRP